MWFATKGFKMVTIKVSKELNHKNRQSQLLGEKQNIKSSTCSLHCGRYSCLRATKDWRGHKIILHVSAFLTRYVYIFHLIGLLVLSVILITSSPILTSLICREHTGGSRWPRAIGRGRQQDAAVHHSWKQRDVHQVCGERVQGQGGRIHRAQGIWRDGRSFLTANTLANIEILMV